MLSGEVRMDREYTTKDGRPVRILCVDGPTTTGRPVIGFVGEETLITRWGINGVGHENSRRLVLKPKMETYTRQGWALTFGILPPKPDKPEYTYQITEIDGKITKVEVIGEKE